MPINFIQKLMDWKIKHAVNFMKGQNSFKIQMWNLGEENNPDFMNVKRAGISAKGIILVKAISTHTFGEYFQYNS